MPQHPHHGALGSRSSKPDWVVDDVWRNTFTYDDVGNRTRWDKYVSSATTTYDYTYNTLNQLTEMAWTSGGDWEHEYTYDKNGNRTSLTIKYNSNVAFVKRYAWDQDDRLIRQWNENSGGTVLASVEFQYCRTCGGQRTARIEKDGSGNILSWKRYEMEGLNHLRIDERYDSDSNGLTESDPWRIERVYVNGPGQLGQIVKQIVYTYASDTTGTPQNEDEYFLGYDVLGNVSVISNSAGSEVDQFEQDAFGNDPENTWTNPAGGITEHLTTKQYDDFMGLYYFNARWYDPQIAAFLSPDPIYRPFHYPISLNCPTAFTDPTGYCVTCSSVPTPTFPPGTPIPTPGPAPKGQGADYGCLELFTELDARGGGALVRSCYHDCVLDDNGLRSPEDGRKFLMDCIYKKRRILAQITVTGCCIQDLITGLLPVVGDVDDLVELANLQTDIVSWFSLNWRVSSPS